MGPTNSSSVGRLMAWTWAQKWPLPSPKSRYHLASGPRFDLHTERFAVHRFVAGPEVARAARANVVSRGALTWISWLMVRVHVLEGLFGSDHCFSP